MASGQSVMLVSRVVSALSVSASLTPVSKSSGPCAEINTGEAA